jgi:hypothetical protein
MADLTLNRFVSSGTTTQRNAFTPSPPSAASGPAFGEFFWDSTLQALYAWDAGSASWKVATASVSVTRGITFAIDGGGVAITTSFAADVYVPYAATITAVTLLADQSGSVVLGISKSSYSGFPGSLTSIVASAAPTLSSAQKSQDTTLTGWTTAISAGDVLHFTVTSVSTITRLNCVLTVTT